MKRNVEFQDPYCKKKIKRIIAREGLISLLFITVPLLFLIGGYKLNKQIYKRYFDEIVVTSPKYAPITAYDKEYVIKPIFYERKLSPQPLTNQEKYMYEKGYNPFPSHIVKVLCFYLLIFGYPFYLLIRFILWAIKTLRERE